MANEDLAFAWAVGVIEGEGCLAKNGPGWALSVSMTDEDIIQRVAAAIGTGRVRGPYAKAGRKPYWTYYLSVREDLIAFLNKAMPLFGERRALKALEILTAFDARPKSKHALRTACPDCGAAWGPDALVFTARGFECRSCVEVSA